MDSLVPESRQAELPQISGDSIQPPRRLAMQLFLESPADAVRVFPELAAELITFFARSSNPAAKSDASEATTGQKDQFKQWEAARNWALEQVSK